MEANPPPTSSHSAIDSLGRGTAILIVGTLVLFLLSFIGRVYAARHLTTEFFGDFNLGLSFAGLLALVALLGLHQAMARTLAERPDPAIRRRLIRWTTVVTGIAATVTSVAVFLLAGPIAWMFDHSEPVELVTVFQLFSVTIGLTLACTFIASIFQGFEDTFPYAILNQGVQPGAFLVFLVILIAFNLQLTAALLAWVISNIITFVVMVFYAWRKLPQHLPAVKPAKELPSGLWELSLSLWGVTTLMFVTGFADTLILGAFRPEEFVGIYSAVMNLARLILIAAGALTFIFLPVTARLSGEGNIKTIRSTYLTSGRWVLVFTAPMFLVFGLLPADSISSIFGANYVADGGTIALLIVTLAALVSVAFGPVNAALAGLGMTRPLLVATAASAVSNIALSFILIPTHGPVGGLVGAAIAWSVSRIIYPAAGMFALHTEHGIGPIHRNYLLPLGLCLGIGAPLFLLVGFVHHPSWVVFPLYLVGMAIFIGAILLTKSVDEEDLVIVRLAEKVLGRPLPKIREVLIHFSAKAPHPEVASPLP